MTRLLRADDVPQRTRCQYSSGVHCEWTWIERHLSGEVSFLYGFGGEPPDLCPDFQRGHVWTTDQRREWVEFRLSGGWGGEVILWNRYPDSSCVLVDGLQRLTAARSFMADELRVFPNLDPRGTGFLRREMEPGAYRRSSRGGRLILVMNELETREEVIRWYLELNAGGTPHSDAEITRVRDLLAAGVWS